MRFTILELRKVFDNMTAKRMISALNQQRNLVVGTRTVRVPFTHRFGAVSTMLQTLNVFDLDRAIEAYEERLVSENHRHVYKRTLRMLEKFHKLQQELS